MNIEEIIRFIVSNDLTFEETSEIAQALQFNRTRTARKNVGLMTVGSTVKFTSAKAGGTVAGTVTKVGRKFLTIRTSTTSWRVPASMVSWAE